MEGETSLTVSRALELLGAFSANQGELGISELSRKLKLSKTAVFRIVHTLEQYGFLEKDELTGKYRIGPQAFRIGNLFTDRELYERKLSALMHDLVEATGFSCYLSTLRGREMIILSAIPGHGPLRHGIPVGQTLPVHSSATGKAALSALSNEELERVLNNLPLARKTAKTITSVEKLKQSVLLARKQGYAVNWEENTIGVVSIGAPIFDKTGHATIVISLGFAASQVKPEDIPALGEKLKRIAAVCAKRLGIRVGRAA